MSDRSEHRLHTMKMRCTTCLQVFVIAIGYPKNAPHGKTGCTGKIWEKVSE